MKYQKAKARGFKFKKLGIPISIFLIFVPFILLAQEHRSPLWNIVPSPITSDLKNLSFVSRNLGFAVGKQIIKFTNGTWEIMNPQSGINPVKVFALNENKVWVVSTTEYQDSKLRFFNGKNWNDIYNPLANNINDIRFISKNYGVISGLGEIAVFKNGAWQFLMPPASVSIWQVQLDGDSVIWARTEEEGIYKYKDSKWKRIEGLAGSTYIKIFEHRLYFLRGNELCFIDNDSIMVHSSEQLLNDISSFDVINHNKIFAAGKNGLILKYENGKWEKQPSPVSYNLNSIRMITDTLGWIVGDEGTILKYSPVKEESFSIGWKGFKIKQLYKYAKVIDDEYGVAAADFNGDGLTDIFVCGLFEKNHLYINYGKNVFLEEAELRGLVAERMRRILNLGVCAGDLDNDGDIDLYVSSLNAANKIYFNKGDGHFIDYSEITGAMGDESDRTNAITFGDVDNDGDLDIFITNENTTNRLFLNNGVGIYKEITAEVHLVSQKGGTGCSFADIDNDGDIDLYVTNWSHENLLYKNLLKESGRLDFADVTVVAGVGGKAYTKSNGVVFADIDNDADVDLFITNRKTSNRLYINNGSGIFTDKTAELIGLDSLQSYGASIEDFDGDGFKDIYLANVGANIFYKNYNGQKFVDETIKFNAELYGYSTGTSVADLDNDGDLDIYVANYIGTSSSIFINNLNPENYVKVKAEGIENNRSGTGTKIYLYASGSSFDESNLISFSVITTGESYASSSEAVKTLSTLTYDNVDLKIIFPSGLEKYYTDVKSGSFIEATDVGGLSKMFLLAKHYVLEWFLNPHLLFNFLKLALVVMLLLFFVFRSQKRFGLKILFLSVVSLFLLALYTVLFKLFEYDNLLFSTILPVSSVVLLLLVFQLYYENKTVRRVSAFEKQQIREKLSRDLHDDLASTISSIAIYIELLKKSFQYKSKNSFMMFNKTHTLIEDAKNSVSDLIWTIKPSRESVEQLVLRIKHNFLNLFKENKMNFSAEYDRVSGEKILEPEIKHNIYLMIKEALNNSLKYSLADNVTLSVTGINGGVQITVKDDGVGFDTENIQGKGNGLLNMKRRAEEIGAGFNLVSELNLGTAITIILK